MSVVTWCRLSPGVGCHRVLSGCHFSVYCGGKLQTVKFTKNMAVNSQLIFTLVGRTQNCGQLREQFSVKSVTVTLPASIRWVNRHTGSTAWPATHCRGSTAWPATHCRGSTAWPATHCCGSTAWPATHCRGSTAKLCLERRCFCRQMGLTAWPATHCRGSTAKVCLERRWFCRHSALTAWPATHCRGSTAWPATHCRVFP